MREQRERRGLPSAEEVGLEFGVEIRRPRPVAVSSIRWRGFEVRELGDGPTIVQRLSAETAESLAGLVAALAVCPSVHEWL